MKLLMNLCRKFDLFCRFASFIFTSYKLITMNDTFKLLMTGLKWVIHMSLTNKSIKFYGAWWYINNIMHFTNESWIKRSRDRVLMGHLDIFGANIDFRCRRQNMSIWSIGDKFVRLCRYHYQSVDISAELLIVADCWTMNRRLWFCRRKYCH